MMRNIILPLIAITFLSLSLKAQNEILLEHGLKANPSTAATIGNRTLFSATNVFFAGSGAFLKFADTNASLYLINHDLKVLKELEVDKYMNMPNANIMRILNMGDSLYAVGISEFFPDFKHDYAVLLLDTALNEVARYRSRGNNMQDIILTSLDIIDRKIFISLQISDTISFLRPQLVVYDPFRDTVLATKDYLTDSANGLIGREAFRRVYPWKNGFFASYAGFDGFNVGYLLDSNLNLTRNITARDSGLNQNLPFPNWVAMPLRPDELLYQDATINYFSGMIGASSMALTRVDGDFNHLRTDTFGFPQAHRIDNIMVNFIQGQTAFRTYDSILMLNNDGYLSDSDFIIETSRISEISYQDMIVVNFDSAGNENWRKIIHQDSAYFIARELELTQDGGVLIFSAKYDRNYKKAIHLRLSIIKLDRFGNVVSEREFTPPQPRWSVYPNPMRSRFTLTGLEENEIVQMQLLNLSGQVMWEQSGRAGAHTLPPQLEKGFYLLQLSNEQGQDLGVRRVMVEGR